MLLMISSWWGGWVWMVVVLGFGFVHGGEREGRKRDINERERERDINVFNVLYRNIKVRMLSIL